MSRLLPGIAAAGCALVVIACDAGPAGPAHVRVANFVPDAPSLDLCFKPASDAAYTTPFVGSSGLAFPALSNRTDVDGGTYSVRIVPGGSGSCNTSLNGLGDISGIVLGEGGDYTVAAVGRLTGTGQGSVALNAYVDDTGVPASGLKLRFVNAAPEVSAADIGVLSGLTFITQAPNVAYPSPTIYFTNPTAIVGAVYAAASPPGTNTVILETATGVNVPNASVSTMWLVGRPNIAGNSALSFLLSSDNANSFSRLP